MRKAKLAKHGEIVKHLKEKHGMGHGYANLVAMECSRAARPARPATTSSPRSTPARRRR